MAAVDIWARSAPSSLPICVEVKPRAWVALIAAACAVVSDWICDVPIAPIFAALSLENCAVVMAATSSPVSAATCAVDRPAIALVDNAAKSVVSIAAN